MLKVVDAYVAVGYYGGIMLICIYLLFIYLFDHGHCNSNLLFLPSDYNLSFVNAGWWDVDAGSSFLHYFSHKLVIGTSNKGVVHFIDVQPLHCTFVLQKVTVVHKKKKSARKMLASSTVY